MNFLEIITGVPIILSALGVIFLKGYIHSILCLIASFLFSAMFLLTKNAEFMSMVIAIVYIGAIAVFLYSQ